MALCYNIYINAYMHYCIRSPIFVDRSRITSAFKNLIISTRQRQEAERWLANRANQVIEILLMAVEVVPTDRRGTEAA